MVNATEIRSHEPSNVSERGRSQTKPYNVRNLPDWRRSQSVTSWDEEPNTREEDVNIDNDFRTKDTGELVTRENAQTIFPNSACCFVAK